MSDGRELKQEAAPQAPAHSRLETWSHASQVLMAGAVIVSLSFPISCINSGRLSPKSPVVIGFMA